MPGCNGVGAAKRSYPLSEARGSGREELPHPYSKERWLCQCRRAQRSYSTFKVRRGGSEEIPLGMVGVGGEIEIMEGMVNRQE